MAPKYKLTYFNLTGIGEPIRYLLHYGNIEFEDNRVEIPDWPKLKPNTPFGHVPILEVDGKEYTQSGAICRYLAKKLNLAGKTDWDALEADIIVDTLTDWRLNFIAWFREQNEEAKEKKLKEIKETENPYYLSRFEEIVKKNGGHFVNKQLTLADVYFAAIMELLNNVNKESLLDNYPNLKALKEKIDTMPSIKAYRDKRPKTM